MLSRSVFSVLTSLGFASLGLADYAVTIPWVGYTISGNYFGDWQGELNGESTTYHVEPHCPTSAHCAALDPPITLIVAPNTYELITTNPGGFIGYSSSACTLTGSPSPTAAHCSYTNSYEFRSSTIIKSDTMNVPDSSRDYTVYPVTLTVASSGSGSARATETAVSTATETTGSSTDSASQGSSNSQVTGTTAGVTAVTTTSGNIAIKTSAPMLAMGGILAGSLVLSCGIF